MISHILLGTATLVHGGLKFTARAAGPRGEETTITITQGAQLAITVQTVGFGAGNIAIVIAAGTTEAQLKNALAANSDFSKLASVAQASGTGEDPVAVLAKTHFMGAGGFLQRLETRLGILGWNDRDVIATGRPVGMLWLSDAKCDRLSAASEIKEYWSGVLAIILAFQHDSDFHTQNAILDLFRRAVHATAKTFDHEDLIELAPTEYRYNNALKDEASGQPPEQSRLRVDCIFNIQWTEAAFDPLDDLFYDIDQIQIGLFREPLTDPLGGPGEEVKDTDIIVEEP